MPLDTPLLRVSRPVAACSRCRGAKIKCDGKLPACTACERANKASECASTNDQFARGKERSYVATLEARVERLEQKIIEARERRKSSLSIMEPSVWSPRRQSTDASRPKDCRAARRKELTDIDELVSDFGFLYACWMNAFFTTLTGFVVPSTPLQETSMDSHLLCHMRGSYSPLRQRNLYRSE